MKKLILIALLALGIFVVYKYGNFDFKAFKKDAKEFVSNFGDHAEEAGEVVKNTTDDIVDWVKKQ